VDANGFTGQGRQAISCLASAMAAWQAEARLQFSGLGMPPEGPSAARLQAAEEARLAMVALEALPGGRDFASGMAEVAAGEVPAVERAAEGARELAAWLLARGAARDAASLKITATRLVELADPTYNRPDLEEIALRWAADPDSTAPALEKGHAALPGGLVMANDESVRCMGDTDYYIRFYDRPSGTEVFGLYDVPLEGVAVSRDGAWVYAQREIWGRRARQREEAVYDLVTGERKREQNQPASARDIVMLTDLFTAAGLNARSPDSTRIDFGPSQGSPSFCFQAFGRE
jgi:hypothetical protein